MISACLFSLPVFFFHATPCPGFVLIHPASGHDLRLDERLQSKRRQLLPTSEAAPSTRSGSSSEEGVSDSGSAVDMDWREEVRLASQLPEDGDFGRGGSTVVKIVEARYPT